MTLNWQLKPRSEERKSADWIADCGSLIWEQSICYIFTSSHSVLFNIPPTECDTTYSTRLNFKKLDWNKNWNFSSFTNAEYYLYKLCDIIAKGVLFTLQTVQDILRYLHSEIPESRGIFRIFIVLWEFGLQMFSVSVTCCEGTDRSPKS